MKEGLVLPNEVLNHARKSIIQTLANDGSEHGGKDGMDAALLLIDLQNKKLNFALANNPLWILRNGELIEHEPDKMPVGRHDKQHIPFTNHEVNLLKGDLIFTFTDGYADQFGGSKGKKFKYSSLKSLILQHHHLKTEELKMKLKSVFDQWKGDLEQVDDVCIIGVKI